ncbi:MAG: 4'-phosphopantetheinyl transferase superfamily protein [Lachnospiraceae bacterium]|nr:4'-phosphopantetheinyl transferase superfamily protein [Lachnospiraceae bacterium]
MKINVVFKRVDAEYLEKNFDSIINMLHLARREKVAKLKNKKAAYVSMTAGLLLQEIVEREFGLKPDDILIGKGENGKPYLKEYPEYKYNISHSGDMVMMAYSKQELGVDIEELRIKDTKVAKRCFVPHEYLYVLNGNDEPVFDGCGEDKMNAERSRRFFEIWTLKEAYLKLSGKGISVPLSSFEVDVVNKCVKNEALKYYTGEIDNYIYAICAEDVTDVRIEN